MTLSEDIAAAQTRGAKRELKIVIDHKIAIAEGSLADVGKKNFVQTIDEVIATLEETKTIYEAMRVLVIEPLLEE